MTICLPELSVDGKAVRLNCFPAGLKVACNSGSLTCSPKRLNTACNSGNLTCSPCRGLTQPQSRQTELLSCRGLTQPVNPEETTSMTIIYQIKSDYLFFCPDSGRTKQKGFHITNFYQTDILNTVRNPKNQTVMRKD